MIAWPTKRLIFPIRYIISLDHCLLRLSDWNTCFFFLHTGEKHRMLEITCCKWVEKQVVQTSQLSPNLGLGWGHTRPSLVTPGQNGFWKHLAFERSSCYGRVYVHWFSWTYCIYIPLKRAWFWTFFFTLRWLLPGWWFLFLFYFQCARLLAQ